MPILTVSGDTLVIAAPTARRRPPRAPGPYRRLFEVPGARAFTAANAVARLPMGMFGISAVMMIAGQRGSYALAGAVTATGLAATAVAAPWTARLVDRHGQARVAVPATLLAVLGSLSLVLCVRTGAPDWTLFASYAATATTPNIGGLSRARWAHLFRTDPAARHTANAFEQAGDELCYMLGPVVAAFLCSAFFPEAGTLTGAALLLTGMLLFCSCRATEPPPAGRSATAGPAPLRTPGMRGLLVMFVAMGAVFGSMEVVSIAHLDAHGLGAAAGPVLALQALGSCLAGLAYGALPAASDPRRRLTLCVAALSALMCLPYAAAGSLGLLALSLLAAGMATAPAMVNGMSLLQQMTPPSRLNEGMTLAVTALLAGIAAGAAGAGTTVDAVGSAPAYLVPATAALAALGLTLAQRHRRAGARLTRP
ncbi:MFS transporter [Streptomyces bambusae]|uniref:MFS transporter n=1 Tax=Streptomyces bambusae TaxID=1550616 RepID=UPI001CFC91E7|nr:MFS transporter [Streptomyces bambusae]MCB5167298.1 MFS transporter [Streptomyces bambusae]